MYGVTFVITAYNKEAFLEGTLNSVLAQDGDFEREFIVIENGSEDRSGEIADDLVGSLPNGRVIRLTPNRGPAIAQNAGAEAATMPAVKFLDGDDRPRRGVHLVGCSNRRAQNRCTQQERENERAVTNRHARHSNAA